ncbi:hypothetical protein KDK95_02090 [Actinospica sp. MGRD01-02]|uniref:Uncharacterized protein n=1 Tax=Actinospica acidithermotolerans TaxID=2828514 RepID=A0A941E2Q6_9ACTN|nr:hypothetical protein [Actinospica acidithermotolerans]MBR7825080.1 hypothetical protein [Actinospica acidithermotolerans]
MHTDHISGLVQSGRGAAAAQSTGDLTGPSPESARHVLVETLLRIGLDLHVALEASTRAPVTRHLHSAVAHTDEALRLARLAALEHASAAETAPSRPHAH